MKISPVVGTPTLPKTPTTSLSPEKMERLKAIAAGQKPEDKAEETVETAKPPAMPKITMQTNKTVHRNGDLPVDAEAPKEGTEIGNGESDNSDTGVQTKPEPEAIAPISPQLAELARQRRALQEERRLFAEEKAAQEAKSSSAVDVERLKKQPLSVLQELGVTYEQLTDEILNSQNGNAEIAALKAQIEELKKGIDDRFNQKDTEQEEAVFTHMKNQVDKMCFSSDTYKFIREAKAQDKVLDLIRKTWKEKGEVLDEAEAMDLIEAELREDAKRYAKLIGELEAPPQPAPAQPAQQTGGIKTITNKDSARPPMSRRQRAIAAALGQK